MLWLPVVVVVEAETMFREMQFKIRNQVRPSPEPLDQTELSQ
jgi:hypothetical protein